MAVFFFTPTPDITRDSSHNLIPFLLRNVLKDPLLYAH